MGNFPRSLPAKLGLDADRVIRQRQRIMYGQDTLHLLGSLAGARHGPAEEQQQEERA